VIVHVAAIVMLSVVIRTGRVRTAMNGTLVAPAGEDEVGSGSVVMVASLAGGS